MDRLTLVALILVALNACDSMTDPAPEAARLAFVTSPTGVKGQEPITPPVTIEVLDQFGDRYTESSVTVTVDLGADPTEGQAHLSGEQTVGASSGIAVLDDLSIDLPGSGYTLTATAPGLESATSGEFSVHLTFATISAGQSHTCGLTTAGHAYCWGSNRGGELGIGAAANLVWNRNTPAPVSGGLTFEAIQAGWDFTCAVTGDGRVFCWGLYPGTDDGQPFPSAVASGQAFTDINGWNRYLCGLRAAGAAYCWGSNDFGQLGDLTIEDRDAPVRVVGDLIFGMLQTGEYHTCGVTTDGDAYCWGRNAFGELGAESTTVLNGIAYSHYPLPVTGGHTFTLVSPGFYSTCGVTDLNEAYCWGSNTGGQLGAGDRPLESMTPVPAAGGHSFAAVSAGFPRFYCGVTNSHEAYCWGVGALGHPTTTSSSVPSLVSGRHEFVMIDPGYRFACGVTIDGDAYCWGDNLYGQLGNGTREDSMTPVRVAH